MVYILFIVFFFFFGHDDDEDDEDEACIRTELKKITKLPKIPAKLMNKQNLDSEGVYEE